MSFWFLAFVAVHIAGMLQKMIDFDPKASIGNFIEFLIWEPFVIWDFIVVFLRNND